MSDILFEEFCKEERWNKAIKKAISKGINKYMLMEMETPEYRAKLFKAIWNHEKKIAPSHAGQVPKDDGTMREIKINEAEDRVILSIINDLLFDLCPDMIHTTCKSYQSGIGTGKVVNEVSNKVNVYEAIKTDLSKYFDSVPIEYIDLIFDLVEAKHGKSCIIDLLREFYHMNLYFDLDGNLIEQYNSLKQGCAVAAFLADAILYDMDEELSKLDGTYVRYSDDCLFVGSDYKKAKETMDSMLSEMGLKLNPKKVEWLDSDHWFCFLGFSMKGKKKSLSKKRLTSFVERVDNATFKRKWKKKPTLEQVIHSVNNVLYVGDGQYSWATGCLGIINSESDIDIMNEYIMDAIRATLTGKTKIGGLGYQSNNKDGVMQRGKGRNVRHNRELIPYIDGYLSVRCMRNALITDKEAYNALIREMM